MGTDEQTVSASKLKSELVQVYSFLGESFIQQVIEAATGSAQDTVTVK